MFKDLDAMVADRATPDFPDAFGDSKLAQSVFGVFRLELDDEKRRQIGEDTLIEEAKRIDQVVNEAVKTHSINPASNEAEIRKNLLPGLFGLLGGLDAAQAVINQIVEIVRTGRGGT